MLFKIILRTIKKSLGRFISILLIVTLGVAFFFGLKTARKAMIKTGQDYIASKKLADFQIFSPAGFTSQQVDWLNNIDKTNVFFQQSQFEKAEGGYQLDVLTNSGQVLKVMSMPQFLNNITLTSGKFPEHEDECLLDQSIPNAKSLINTYITIKEEGSFLPENYVKQKENSQSHSFKSQLPQKASYLSNHKFKVVGLAISPLYMNMERGTTSLGDGSIKGFMLVVPTAFGTENNINNSYSIDSPSNHTPVYNILYIKTKASSTPAYTTEYNQLIKKEEEPLKELVLNALSEQTAGGASTDNYKAAIKDNLILQNRKSNIGYVSFDNDSQIINDVSTVFPLFFILVAALVCMTSMSRLIDEDRGQIGVLKAMGYNNQTIMWAYLSYSISATFIGTITGLVIGTFAVPQIIWDAYSSVYNFSEYLNIVFPLGLAALVLAVSIFGSIIATGGTFFEEMKELPAALMKPKAPKAGKAIFLEKLPYCWNRLSFLHKIMLRNVFLYKKRLFMMIMGIGGATALLITGLGIKSSIQDIPTKQYKELYLYNNEIHLIRPVDSSQGKELAKTLNLQENSIFLSQVSGKISNEKKTMNIKIITLDKNQEKDIKKFINLSYNGVPITYPQEGYINLSQKYATGLKVKQGDLISLKFDHYNNRPPLTLKVNQIFDNYIYGYGYITSADYSKLTGEDFQGNSFLTLEKNDAKLDLVRQNPQIGAVAAKDKFASRVNQMIDNLFAVITFIIICAGALALIVLYNLTNINITERIREIATTKVLGFSNREVCAYVFREVIFLTILGACVGIGLGRLLQSLVISMIHVEMLDIPVVFNLINVGITIGIIALFTLIIALFMAVKLAKVDMNQSLKSPE